MKFVPAFVLAALMLGAPAVAAPTQKAAAAKSDTHAHVTLPSDVRPERYAINIVPNADKLTFEGHEAITVTVKRATKRIVLNAADIAVQKVSISCLPDAPTIAYDKDQQTVAFTFSKAIEPGRYTLALDYTGLIYEQASGLFALDYQGANGKQRAIFTQFENSDARRLIPSWDEPGVKAVYSLTVQAPAGQIAVSNMPVAAATPAAGGAQSVRFADTPKMSSYLLFLAVGDFERVHRMVGKTDVGVVVRRGDTAKAQFALDAATELLPFYNDYFGTPYPLPKLDFIAGPGRSQFFSAMENWGAIFYFDYALLVDSKLTTESDKQGIYVDIAHEMAHQWFGDLVTMAWWDDLWLNEGFASWMENKATDRFHPEWKIWLQTKAGEQAAMSTDAKAGSHPVITPIHDVFAAANAFDGITYQKGHAVIHMLEDYVGPDVFRAGVRNYIAHHAYGNTVTDDLWSEVDKVSPKKITGIAHDFTLQAGVPLISIAQAKGGLTLSQGRFGADAASKTPRSWRTPVTIGGLGTPWKTVVSAKAPATRGAAGTPVLNAGQVGYFRSRYAPELETRVVAAFPSLDAKDQLGLVYDSFALGAAGYAPMSDFLAIAKSAETAKEPVVARALAGQLDGLNDLYQGQAGKPAYQAFARARLAAAARRLGWDAKPGEPDNDAVLRRIVLVTLGDLGDPQVVAEARRRFTAWLAAPDSLKGTTRQTVLQIVANQADSATWEQLHALAQKATDTNDRTRFYRYLGVGHDPALADRALALALSKEPPATDAPELITAVATNFPDKAFDFAMAHRAEVDVMVEPTSRTSFYARLGGASNQAAMIAKLNAFAATAPASTRGEVTKAIAAITYRQQIVEKRLPEVDRWLAAHPG